MLKESRKVIGIIESDSVGHFFDGKSLFEQKLGVVDSEVYKILVGAQTGGFLE